MLRGCVLRLGVAPRCHHPISLRYCRPARMAHVKVPMWQGKSGTMRKGAQPWRTFWRTVQTRAH
eukprot:1959028-Pyramimonas_sp.AAC.1